MPYSVGRYHRRGRPIAPGGSGSVRDSTYPLSCMRPSVTYTVPRLSAPCDRSTSCRPNNSLSRSRSRISRSVVESRGISRAISLMGPSVSWNQSKRSTNPAPAKGNAVFAFSGLFLRIRAMRRTRRRRAFFDKKVRLDFRGNNDVGNSANAGLPGVRRFMRVIRTAHERARLDVDESEIERDLFQRPEFVWMVVADHRRVLR